MRKHQWKYAIIIKRCHLVHCPTLSFCQLATGIFAVFNLVFQR